jgi:hypothetical protein
MKKLDVPQSGKRGVEVSKMTRYGLVVCAYVAPRDPRAPDQIGVRSKFGRAPARWRSLTDEQRGKWADAAEKMETQPSVSQSGRMSGYLLFVKINDNLAFIGLPAVDVPPPGPVFDDNLIEKLCITNIGGVAELKLRVTGTPTQHVLIFATAPCSAGVSFAKHFTYRGLMPAPDAGFSTISGLYVPKYGVPPVGSRVFVRTQQQSNGRRNPPRQFTAIVQPA